jgi:hypothetical protein
MTVEASLFCFADSFLDSSIFHSWKELPGLPDKTQVFSFIVCYASYPI